MKKLVLGMLIAFVCFTLDLAAQSTVAPNKYPLVDIGVMDIFDLELKWNHNQAFKKFLAKSAIKMDGKIAKVDLVEHQSGSKVAINAVWGNNRVISTIYNEGKIVKRDTFRVFSIEKTRQAWKLALGLIQTPAGITIATADSSYLKLVSGNRNKLKIGHVVLKIDDKLVGNDLLAANQLLVLNKDKWVPVEVLDPATGKKDIFYCPIFQAKVSDWEYPLNEAAVSSIFKLLYANLSALQNQLGLSPDPLPENAVKGLLSSKSKQGKCKAQEQLATYSSKTHPVALTNQKTAIQTQKNTPSAQAEKSAYGVTGNKESTAAFSSKQKIESIFRREVFYYPEANPGDQKKWEAGDAALMVMQYYNYNQNESHLTRHHSVSEDLKESVKKLSGSYYNKPGVYANYFAAAVDYELYQNYGAALNQYYASLRKIDDIICSELTKVQAKKIALERIAFCSGKLGQTNYAGLLSLAGECLKSLDTPNSELSKGHNNFYEFTQNIQSTSISIEQKLKEQRVERVGAIVGSVVSIAAGVATVGIDAGLSSSFLFNAVDIMDQNAKFNAQTNLVLAETTGSIVINLPAELANDERSPYEIMATSYINYALVHSSTPGILLDKISDFAKGNPALKTATDKTKATWQESGKLDLNDLVNELLRTETLYYRYEKRGLKVPETDRT